MKHYLLFILFLAITFSSCDTDPNTYVIVDTEYGVMKLKLYENTPLHKENFIKIASEGYYDGLLFHRIIDGFMIQGGDPDSRNAAPGQVLGMGGPGYEIPSEINSENYHYKGVLAAARNNNPQKMSSGSQFYIVHGGKVDDNLLNRVEERKGIKYTAEQRNRYKAEGGSPILDSDYTVFGELVEGIDVLDKLAKVQTGRSDRPIKDVKMVVSIAQ